MELVGRGLTKRYPGVLALSNVDVSLRGGEVRAIVGENGAGKSTLMQILSGATAADEGTIAVDGREVRFQSPRDSLAMGIRMIHQELSLVPALTVAENISLGAEPRSRGVVDRARQLSEAHAVLVRLGRPDIDPSVPVERLSLAARQMTEIAKAVSGRVRVLILDEPTAILAEHETESLMAVIGQLRAEGVAIAYITHRMDEVFRVADHVMVMRDGEVVGQGAVAAMSRGDVVRQMVGRELAGGYPQPLGIRGDEVLRLEHVSVGPVRDVSLALRRGEVVSVAGVVGSGRTELARGIFGAERLSSGTMLLDGKPYRPGSPRAAIASGVALLPEDRKGQGLILSAAIRENVSLPSLDRFQRAGVVDRETERRGVEDWIASLRVRTPSIDKPVGQLSGGNQQKVVVARWMLANARVLIFDEPTRGIDVGAKAEIYALMRELAAKGAAILMISSDLPEAIGMADRLIVMRDGRITGELARDAITDREVGRLMFGESAAA